MDLNTVIAILIVILIGIPIILFYRYDKKRKIEKEKKKAEEIKKNLEERIATAPKIKCSYCEQWFPKLTDEEYRVSASVNVLKWAFVPEWGVVGALKNKPFIKCPHCGMKIMQG